MLALVHLKLLFILAHRIWYVMNYTTTQGVVCDEYGITQRKGRLSVILMNHLGLDNFQLVLRNSTYLKTMVLI